MWQAHMRPPYGVDAIHPAAAATMPDGIQLTLG
jgi:hypothetical protein